MSATIRDECDDFSRVAAKLLLRPEDLRAIRRLGKTDATSSRLQALAGVTVEAYRMGLCKLGEMLKIDEEAMRLPVPSPLEFLRDNPDLSDSPLAFRYSTLTLIPPRRWTFGIDLEDPIEDRARPTPRPWKRAPRTASKHGGRRKLALLVG